MRPEALSYPASEAMFHLAGNERCLVATGSPASLTHRFVSNEYFVGRHGVFLFSLELREGEVACCLKKMPIRTV